MTSLFINKQVNINNQNWNVVLNFFGWYGFIMFTWQNWDWSIQCTSSWGASGDFESIMRYSCWGTRFMIFKPASLCTLWCDKFGFYITQKSEYRLLSLSEYNTKFVHFVCPFTRFLLWHAQWNSWCMKTSEQRTNEFLCILICSRYIHHININGVVVKKIS